MLSIDEAIAKYKENAKLFKQTINIAYGLELEQIAGWLEELKAIKDGSIPIIHGKAELELHDKAIRNEAIDEFIYTIKPRMKWDDQSYSLAIEHCINIAEQLKE